MLTPVATKSGGNLRRFLAMVLLLVAAACSPVTTELGGSNVPEGSELVAFEPTREFLLDAIGRLSTFESYAFEGYTDTRISSRQFGDRGFGSREVASIRGQVVGETTRAVHNYEPLFANILDEVGYAGSLELTLIRTDRELYVTVPVNELWDQEAERGESRPLDAWEVDVIDSWAKIDLLALGDAELDGLQGLLRIQIAEAAPFIASVVGEVETVFDGGGATVGGIRTQIAGSRIELREFMSAREMTVEDLFGIPDSEVADAIDRGDVVIKAYIDEQGILRRLEYSLDFGDVLDEILGGGSVFDVWQRMDLIDVGVPAEIELPSAPADITDAVLATLAASPQGG